MDQIPFIFKKLSIHKMPGFPKGMATYRDLSPGINIVAGPNASGKSSTARMLQKLIWRDNTAAIHAESSAEINREGWQINIDSGHIQIQCEGKDETIVGLPSSQAKSRYILALHELVKENEQELAQQILQESIGGYNLDEAAQSLIYEKGIRNRSATDYVNYKKADDHLKKVLNQQSALKKKEEKLESLYKEKKKAQQASRLKDLYGLVIAYLKAKRDFNQSREQYETYPKVMEKVNGDELTTIQEREKEIQDAEEAIQTAQKEIEQSRKLLSTLNLPEVGVDVKALNELDERIAELEETSREKQDKKQFITEKEAKVREALKNIDESLEPENWKGIDLKNISNLEDFLREAHQTISEKQFLEARIGELEKEIEGNSEADSDVLKDGIRALTYWLQEKKSFYGISTRWIWILSAVAGITAILTYLTGWPGLMGLVIVGAVAIYAYQRKPESEENVRKQDFERTGLTPPESWDIEKVSGKLKELIDELNEAKLRENLRQKIEELGKELDEAQKREDGIKRGYDEWMDHLKAVPDLPQEHLRNYSGLYAFLTAVKDWQNAHTDLKALKDQQQELQKRYSHILQQINALFVDNGAPKAEDTGEAKAILKKLKEKEEKRSKNVDLIETKKETIKEKENFRNKNTERLQALYNKLEVEYGNKERIRELVNWLDPYKNTKEDYQGKKSVLADRTRQMMDHSLYSQYKNDIETISLDEAQEKLQNFKDEADKLDEITKQINDIERDIFNAKQGNDLEQALMKREQALDQLEGLYQNNLASLTGKILVDQLKQETRERNRPAVFKRANELFNRITSGRYELMLGESEEASFRAFDTVMNLGQDLSELSTGTRIQLLLSVRLAFIENQEASLKLPLLADELLANSDDARAKAIIDALVEISRDGRQIFYFTAQGDEVAKWESYLASMQDISYKTIFLTGKQNENVQLTSHSEFKSVKLEHTTVPSPYGKSHEEYGNMLEVPSFNLLTDNISQLHLWYLIEDNQLLYNCLKNDLNYWGQLDSYLKNGGILDNMEKHHEEVLRDKAKLLERFQELYRQGRPRPIDRSILEQSGAVSEKFIDAVSDLLNSLQGNPEKLLRALKDGQVQGFRKNKMEELEQFLLEQGYMDDQTPMKEEDIWINLKALISNLSIENGEAEKLIERVLKL